MDGARWQRVQSVFHEAADLPGPAQRAFLDALAADDAALAAEVSAMLRHDASPSSLLDRPMAVLAGGVLGDRGSAVIPPDRFGPYRVTRVLGEGGMGVVFLGTRDDLGSVAAIKVLRDAWLSPARRDRFRDEQRILAQLNYRSIAQLYDADTLDDGTPWFAMEYVEGAALTDYCRASGASLRERLRLFREVCEAVQHAHRHLVIHRDLKPSNILVRSDATIKLLDFGISKQADAIDRLRDATVTRVGHLTPAYAAPEQARGGVTGVYTDVYALGVILFELLTGRLPFEAAAGADPAAPREAPRPSAVAAADIRAGAPAVTRRGWADLDVLCLTAMHADSRRRYASVEALIRDIDHYLREEPLEARRDGVGYRAGKFARRHRRPLTAAAAGVCLVAALVAFFTVRLATARNLAVAEALRTERIQKFTLGLFDGGDKDAGPADTLRAVTLVDRGVLQAQLLDREPLVQAELYETLGGIYRKLGKLDRADDLLQSALRARRARLGPGGADTVKSGVALGRLRSDQARFDEAEALARDAVARARAVRPRDDGLLAMATGALGQILEQRGAYTQAIETLEDAVRLQSRPGAEPSDLAVVLFDLAGAHFYAGHLDTSQTLNRRVLQLHRDLYGGQHPLVAEDLINLGAIEHERGQYAAAEALYRQALGINQAWYGRDSYPTASTLTMLGRSLEFQDRFDEAQALLSEALAIHEQVFGPVHPRVASALNELGNIAMKREQSGDAERYYRRIGDIYRAIYGEGHYLVGIAASNLAGVYMARRDFPAAERLYRDAIATFGRAQSPEHLNTGIARIKLGRALLRQRRWAEAERESLAGYEIVGRQAAPTVSWLKAARQDLAAIYEALGEPAQAARFKPAIAEGRGAAPGR